MKRCIVHIPNKLNPQMASASQIRPRKMIEAFEKKGYVVDVVEGYSWQRKKLIVQIIKNIQNGIKYDFLYAESSTMPTLLTDPNHFPLHPLIDYLLFKWAKKYDIKIGLFYRDMYWMFEEYHKKVHGIKAVLAILMYQYDLKIYSKYLDKLYQPTEKCHQYIQKYLKKEILDTLPPGCDQYSYKNNVKKGKITLLYVGGIVEHYQILTMLAAISEVPDIELILCCRANEWESQKASYAPYLKANIRIVHESGEALNRLYDEADIGLLLIQPDQYIEMAMPYKTFEYIGHGLPIIASDQTAVGDLVNREKIGWTVKYQKESIINLLNVLLDNKDDIIKIKQNSLIYASSNRWEDRASKVINDLSV